MIQDTRGGAGRIEVNFDELERGTVMLHRSAEELAGAWVQLAARTWTAPGTAHWDELAAAAAAEAVLDEAADLTRVLWVEVAATAEAVEHSRAAYRAAEEAAARVVNEARAQLLPWLVARDAATNAGRPRQGTVEDLVNQAPAMVGTLLGLFFPRAFPVAAAPLLRDSRHGGLFDASVAERLYPVLAGTGASQQWVDVDPIDVVGVEDAGTATFCGSLNDVMALQQRAERAGDGRLLVASVDGREGPVHVVVLPGTQTGTAMGRTNPWNEGGIVEGAGLGSQHVAAAVGEALRATGVEPGERIVLTGYSQGGIHAANIAADPRISGVYDVEHVVTFGAPVGGAALPEGVRGYHFEHVDDPVPGADGLQNPDVRERVTVRLDGYAPGTDRSPGGFGAAHGLDNYAYGARAAEVSTDPTVVEATGALGAVFAGAGVARVQSVALRRRVPPDPLPARRPTGPEFRYRRGWAPGGP